MIPTFETDRLILRPQRTNDWPAYFELMSSERSIYMGGPFSKTAAWGMFCHDVGQWALMGHGALMIDERSSRRCVGQVGINHGINHGPLFPELELGWFLYSGAEGQGYAYEAARALRDWAFEVRKLDALVSYMDPNNLKSRKLAERLGGRLDGDAVRTDPADLVFRYASTSG